MTSGAAIAAYAASLSHKMSRVSQNGPAFFDRTSAARSPTVGTGSLVMVRSSRCGPGRGVCRGRRRVGARIRRSVREESLEGGGPGVDVVEDVGIADAGDRDGLVAAESGAFELHRPGRGLEDRSLDAHGAVVDRGVGGA